VNPDIIYARGSGQGVRGPDAGRGGYDAASYWARGGIAAALTPPALPFPIGQRAAMGDLPGGVTIAGGIAAALFRRERTGQPSVVDVSLLGCAMWTLSPDIVASKLYGGDPLPKFDRTQAPNPVTNTYATSDGRHITLIMLQADRFWPDLCRRIGRPDLIDDPRFADGMSRYEHREACVAELDAVFGSRTLAEWKEALADAEGVWAPVQTAVELHDDPQVVANGYVTEVKRDDGVTFPLVASPVQFDGSEVVLQPAPEHGQHTEEILLELGCSWDDIARHKESGAVL
jgi:crotonobetainyl-CoA:carnitine CoA-transferase CaiB-like acyl-CoA transferase